MGRRLRAFGLGGAIAAILLTGGGCELAEVAAPASSDVLVVEALLRVGAWRQHVLLHRSIQEGVVLGESGASVRVTGPDGLAVDYQEVDLSYCVLGDASSWELEDVEVAASCYVATPDDPSVFPRPATTYELRIETSRGEIVRGRTTVPAAQRFIVPAVAVDPVDRSAECTLPSTPFELTWSSSAGAWSYLVVLQLSDWAADLVEQGIEVPDPLELTGVSVSAADTTLLFPEHLGLFQRFDLDRRVFERLRLGLPEEGQAILVVLAADRNYTNAIRGGRFNPSGNLRLSSVVGDGVGVFGSLVPLVIRSIDPDDGTPLEPCPLEP